jgi:hypothetical protein
MMKRSFDVAMMIATVIDDNDADRMKDEAAAAAAAAAEQNGSTNNPRHDDGRHPNDDGERYSVVVVLLRRDELWRRIGHFLPPVSLVQLQRTCRRFHAVLADGTYVERYIRGQPQPPPHPTGSTSTTPLGDNNNNNSNMATDGSYHLGRGPIRTLGQLALVQKMNEAGLFHENRIGFQFASLEIEDDDDGAPAETASASSSPDNDDEESFFVIPSFVNHGVNNNNNNNDDGGGEEVEVVGRTSSTNSTMVRGSRQRIHAIHEMASRFRHGGVTLIIEAHCGRAAPWRVAQPFSVDRGTRMAEYYFAKLRSNHHQVAITTHGWGRQVADVAASSQYIDRTGG